MPVPMTARSTRRRALLRLAALAALFSVLGAVLPARAATVLPAPLPAAPRGNALPPRGPLVTVRHGVFTLAGRPFVLHGVNYEGPSDRPWHMWEDGRFDPALIGRDFDLIAAGGYNPVRVFVQRPLSDEVLAGDYTRLDTVVALAAARGLRLLITFNDDGDRDLTRVTRIDALIAAHLAGAPAVFGYDLRNEPSLADVAASTYPRGTALPLLSPALATAYGMGTAPASGTTGQGQAASGADANVGVDPYRVALHVLDRFMAANPAYPIVAPAPYWVPFLTMANASLAAYVRAQLAAVRAADPTHLVTVGYSSRFWSALPANAALDFRSIHIYPPADFEGFHAALRRFDALNALAPSPLVLEEYGVSNDQTGRQSSAVREAAAALYMRALGGGGDIKWMFDDDAVGYNAFENNLGAVDARGVPKPTYLASAAAAAYAGRTPYAGGLALLPDPLTGAGFVYAARDALAIGGSAPYSDTRVAYTPSGPGVLWLDWSVVGVLRVTPTSDGRLTLNMGALTGAAALAPAAASLGTTPVSGTTSVSGTAPITTALSGGGDVATTAGLTVTLALRAGAPLVLVYRPGAATPLAPVDLPAPVLQNGLYEVARGHNVAPPFLAPWRALGGDATAGLPLTEAFTYHGLPTQYFDNVALRIGPNGPTTAPLGLVALGGPLPRARELPAATPHVYDAVSGHNVHGAFLDYWRATGGRRFWGGPLSEEVTVGGRPAQYFTGAVFVMTPPPHGHVALLPLGRRLWPSERLVYGL